MTVSKNRLQISIYNKEIEVIIVTMKKEYRFRQRKDRKVEVLFLGNDKWFTTGCDSKQDATAWAEANKSLYVCEQGKDPYIRDYAGNFWTRRDSASFYMSNYNRNKRYADRYYELAHSQTVNYIIPTFGRFRLSQITPLMIDRWFLSLVSILKKKPLSDNSKNKILMTLSAMYGEAIRNELCKSNPCDHIKVINESHAERAVLTDAEMKVLFPDTTEQAMWVWRSLMWATYFNIMRCTGFRPGEVAGLTVDNYYKELGGVFTSSSVDSYTKSVKPRIKTTNNGKKYKVGLIDGVTKELLECLISRLPEGKKELFLINGRVMTTKTSNRKFRNALKRVGIDLESKSQYSIRHTFMTSISGEVDSSVVKELMGHTGYREEYDHREGQKRLQQLQSLRDVIESIV